MLSVIVTVANKSVVIISYEQTLLHLSLLSQINLRWLFLMKLDYLSIDVDPVQSAMCNTINPGIVDQDGGV